MKIAILLGSIRAERQSHKVAQYLEKKLNDFGLETDLIDLALDPLPLMGEIVTQDEHVRSRIEKLGKRLNQAQAIILVTPEYHGSFSGALKNALDFYWAEFQRKAIGVVATSSGKMGGINASTQLQHVVLSLGAYPLPVKLLVPEIHLAFNEQDEAVNERFISSTEKFVTEFLWYADAINAKKSREKALVV